MVSDTGNNTRKNQLPDLCVCEVLLSVNQKVFPDWEADLWAFWSLWEPSLWMSRPPVRMDEAMATCDQNDLLTSCLLGHTVPPKAGSPVDLMPISISPLCS